MSRPSNTSYSAQPEDITRTPNQPTGANANCCSFTFTRSGRWNSTGKIQQLRADGVTPNGQNDSPWTGEVTVTCDCSSGSVTVTSRIKAVNKTSDTASYPGTTTVSDGDLAPMLEKIPPAIERAWNAKPYKLKITTARCGEQLFPVTFVVRMVTSGEHFTINFVNVPGMGTANDVRGISSGRSYIIPPNQGKFNLGDSRTAGDNAGDECLEPHEYGHMIGLKDEYRDVPMDRGGVKYQFPDASTETAAVNGELMGSMSTKTARPTRYCVTIAYAAISLLEANGYPVTDCVIL